MKRFLFLLLAALCLLGSSAHAQQKLDQAARWRAAKIDPRQTIALDRLVARYQRTRAVYEQVQAMHPNGVPAPVAFALFYRECDNNFSCSPAQGDSLLHRSINEPKGRIPGKTPPFLWRDAAFDAYYVYDKLQLTNWQSTQSALDRIESFNGFGYRSKGIAAPYLWSGTDLYRRGKYVADHKFDPLAIDKELGVAPILLRLQQRGVIALPFQPCESSAKPPDHGAGSTTVLTATFTGVFGCPLRNGRSNTR